MRDLLTTPVSRTSPLRSSSISMACLTASLYTVRRIVRYTVAALATTTILASCSLDRIVDVDDPESGEDVDRRALNSIAGAQGLYYDAFGGLGSAVSVLSRDVGIFTDELQAVPFTHSNWNDVRTGLPLDARVEERAADGVLRMRSESYSGLYTIRTTASQARFLFRIHGSELHQSYISATYALEATAVLLLAENFCSGIPLTNVPFEGDIEYGTAQSTENLLWHAVALFDSALQTPNDSMPWRTLARVGKGRALLSLGRYAEAATAVQDVGPDDAFVLSYTESTSPAGDRRYFWTYPGPNLSLQRGWVVGNLEGLNGLVWIAPSGTTQDPRLPLNTTTSPPRQQKFPNGNAQLRFASWIDAKMIKAEALLHDAGAGTTWLAPINEARSTVGLDALDDPVLPEARVDLLFRERAFWFYLHGTRLADYRRLVRQYQRGVSDVYPSGVYDRSDGSILSYGNGYVFSPPPTESDLNYRYTGCIHQNP